MGDNFEWHERLIQRELRSWKKNVQECREFEAGRSLGRAVANTVRVVAPSAIAIGGVLGASPVVKAAINSSPEVTNLAVVSPQTSLVPARLGEEAAVLGGLAVVLDRVGAGMSQFPDWARHDQD